MTTYPPPAPDDAELLRRSARSSAAFRSFYDRHVARVHAFMLRRTGDSAVAFELTAETFAEAWLSRGRFLDRGEGAAPWLFGIARNVISASVREHRVRQQARRRLGLDAAAEVAAPEDHRLDGLDAALRDAVDDLPETQRAAVEMRVLGDAAYPEIAATLDITEGAARVRVHRVPANPRRARGWPATRRRPVSGEGFRRSLAGAVLDMATSPHDLSGIVPTPTAGLHAAMCPAGDRRGAAVSESVPPRECAAALPRYRFLSRRVAAPRSGRGLTYRP